MNLRQFARGKPCLIRIPGVCNHDPETTVLCHLRMAGISGMGIKAPDLLGAWACSDCHAAVDGQRKTALTFAERRLALLEAVTRTQLELIRRGVLKW